ncbi:MAG: hypothetical protein MI748_08625, partial [Opitutales bacterium]|nr:hypothetical protein [Opitutales bacterium]
MTAFRPSMIDFLQLIASIPGLLDQCVINLNGGGYQCASALQALLCGFVLQCEGESYIVKDTMPCASSCEEMLSVYPSHELLLESLPGLQLSCTGLSDENCTTLPPIESCAELCIQRDDFNQLCGDYLSESYLTVNPDFIKDDIAALTLGDPLFEVFINIFFTSGEECVNSGTELFCRLFLVECNDALIAQAVQGCFVLLRPCLSSCEEMHSVCKPEPTPLPDAIIDLQGGDSFSNITDRLGALPLDPAINDIPVWDNNP